MHQIQNFLGLCPKPCWKSLQRSSQTSSWWGGLLAVPLGNLSTSPPLLDLQALSISHSAYPFFILWRRLWYLGHLD